MLAAVWLLTRSETLQWVSLFACLWIPTIIARRRYGHEHHEQPGALGKSPPWRLFGLSVLLVLPIGIAVFLLSGAIELGLFWFVVLLWPWIEIYEALLHRDLRRNGAAAWPRESSLRDGAIAGALTAASIFVFGLLFGMHLGEAALAGVLCALIVVALGLVGNWLDRRAF